MRNRERGIGKEEEEGEWERPEVSGRAVNIFIIILYLCQWVPISPPISLVRLFFT